MKKIKIAGIIKESIVDGPGLRLVVFSQGCHFGCPSCQNKGAQDFNGGYLIDTDEIISLVRKNTLLDGITLSGGEPFEQAPGLAVLAHRIKELGLSVIVYTGYTYEYLASHSKERDGWEQLLSETDILVDGRFEENKKSIELKFRGSSNQRLIDLPKTMRTQQIVLAAL